MLDELEAYWVSWLIGFWTLLPREFDPTRVVGVRGLFFGGCEPVGWIGIFFCAWVEVVVGYAIQKTRFWWNFQNVFVFFLLGILLPRKDCGKMISEFWPLAFFFQNVEGEKKTSIDWSRRSHNCAPVISEAIAISRRVGKILENRIEWKKPVGCLRLGNHLLPSDMKSNVGFINKPLEGILLFTMEGNKGVSFSMLNWWHGEKIKTSCVFCFNPCFFWQNW